jgi:hypothetical protein
MHEARAQIGDAAQRRVSVVEEYVLQLAVEQRAANTSTWRMKSFFASGVSSSHGLRRSFGQGVSFASWGTMPSRFWFSKMRSRSFS